MKASRDEFVTTSVRVPRRVWELLRALAHRQSLEEGRSVGAGRIVAELVEAEAAKARRAL